VSENLLFTFNEFMLYKEEVFLRNIVLEIENLRTSFRIKDNYYAAVDDVSLTVKRNELLAIVGESGCGKSALAFSIMGLHSQAKVEGNIYFKGRDIAHISPTKLNKLRGKEMGMIFQDSLSALNPLMIIGDQIGEIIYIHNTKLSKKDRKEKVIDLLTNVGILHPAFTYDQFPHELSGGMRQRVVIAMAIANEPELLIADEPTTALDVTIQSQILDLIKKLKEDIHAGIILITHDLGVVAEMADRVAVMYAGQIVEIADVYTLFENPLHPYTRSLLNSVPNSNEVQSELHVIEGIVPSLQNLPRDGCRFSPRIPWMDDSAHEKNPELHEVNPGHFVRCTCYQNFHFPDKSKGGQRHVVS
jgi:peptide/nickel transport system ATP-binding protein